LLHRRVKQGGSPGAIPEPEPPIDVVGREYLERQVLEMPMDKIPMTAVGHRALEEELERRIRDERPHLIERIRQSIADEPNLVENSEYQAAKADQEVNEMRIAELEDKLARADVIDVSKLSGDTVRFGATVTLIDEDSEQKSTWQIVGEPEADPNKRQISVSSPLARALIGKAKGASVEVEAPGGARSYKVSKVEWRERGSS
jgi:transcription elongation factor GreA